MDKKKTIYEIYKDTLDEEERKKELLDYIRDRNKYIHHVSYDKDQEIGLTFQERLDLQRAEKLKLQNYDLGQNIKLKKYSLIALFAFLFLETIVIFVFAWCQATSDKYNFYLEEWSFRLLTSATISQITIMLVIAVKHLFPKK